MWYLLLFAGGEREEREEREEGEKEGRGVSITTVLHLYGLPVCPVRNSSSE